MSNKRKPLKNLFTSTQDINPETIDSFKPLDKHYWRKPEDFIDLISFLPNVENIEAIIKSKPFTTNQRDQLVQIFEHQYRDIVDPICTQQIATLKNSNCYTVICAHQGLLLGGPLYFWYKIAHTISLCNELKRKYPQYSFIPIFYCGLEDHDFEEINHCFFFNKKVEWLTEQKGATGRMNPNAIMEVFKQLEPLFSSSTFALSEIEMMKLKLAKSTNYADFCRNLIHHIFGPYGLLFFNPDHPEAKRLFASEMIEEVKHQNIFQHSRNSCDRLGALGYQPQAHIRVINLFYLADQYRVGIYSDGTNYHTKDLKYMWNESELLDEIKKHPESFSPNVVLRPLYQEFLFPNIVFIGGGAEIAYWLQLKSAFIFRSIAFPILWRRVSGIIFNKAILNKIEKLKLNWDDFLLTTQRIEAKYIEQNSQLIRQIHSTHESIKLELEKHITHGLHFDESFQTSLAGDLNRLNQQLEKLTLKLVREEKTKHETDLLKIQKIKDNLFPLNGLQERYESGMQYFLCYGPSFVQELINISNSRVKMIALFLNA